MQDKQKIFLVFIGLALVICSITGAAGYYIDNVPGAVYGLEWGIIVSGIVAGCLYYLPAAVIIKLFGGKEITKEDSPDFIRTIEEFAEIVDIPRPRLYLSDKDIPLIFTVGRDCTSASILLTEKLSNILYPEELTCVIMHEMALIKQDRIFRQTLVAFIAGILTMFTTFELWSALVTGFDQEDNPALRVIKFLALVLVTPPAVSLILIHLLIPSDREYIADATAIEFYNKPKVYIKMLEKMGRWFNDIRYEDMNPAYGLLNIVNPLPWTSDTEDDFYALFNTHASIGERIEAIHMVGRQV